MPDVETISRHPHPALRRHGVADHPDLAPPIVDVVIPVYDEEATLERSVERLHQYLDLRFPFSWRITIVDNASTDSTWRKAENLAAGLDGVRALHLDRKGRGRALRAVWSASDAAVVAYMDVDLSTDLDALLPLVAPLVSGHSDVAIGSRLAPASSVARAPKREFISRSYNLILRTVMATRVRDAQCGFKAVRSDVARRLVPAVVDDDWFFDTELLLLAERNGLRIHEVPVDWVDDPDSRVHITSTAWGDIKGTARMFRTFASGRGKIDFGPVARRPLRDDLGRRLVSFGLIGITSTAVSLVLFLLLQGTVGPVPANAVAVSATFVANTWANARLTMRVARPRWGWAFVLFAGSLALTSAALLLVDALGGGLTAEVLALLATWIAVAVGRLLIMSRESIEGAAA
jgi:glycosyltransferase involved in cell wall biosynthesis/putative flippase GtrA